MKTGYPLRQVTAAELVAAFGSAAKALDATGGNNAKACFYLANPDQIPKAQKVKRETCRLTDLLLECRRLERIKAREDQQRAAEHKRRLAVEALHNAVAEKWKAGTRKTAHIAQALGQSSGKIARVVSSLKHTGRIRDTDPIPEASK